MPKVKRTSKVKGDLKSSLQNCSLVQGTLFEENYLQRTHKTLTTNPEIALTELVANAWDAGATIVNITIPDEYGQRLVIEDNGIGMTYPEFSERWLRLGYNRLQHQGKNVEFPPSNQNLCGRIAFGRNGIGRHGLLCFNDQYTVRSSKDGTQFEVDIDSLPTAPIHVKRHEVINEEGWNNGVKLSTIATQNLPSPGRILNALSARFVTNPNFKIYVHGECLSLSELEGVIEHSGPIKVTDEITIAIHFIDTEKSLRKGIYQGVAFWQNNRLVGEPSWIVGDVSLMDGRTTEAKRYTFIVESNDLGDYVKPDWTGFREDSNMMAIYDVVIKFATEALGRANQKNIKKTTETVLEEHKEEYKALSALGKYEVAEIMEHIAKNHPTAPIATYQIAVEAAINLSNKRNGRELLQRLEQLPDSELTALDELLSKWSVKDALVVLDEIDRRLSAIEAIRKLSSNKKTDELHTLHPLITESRWIFGPEYDSLEYRSNSQLQTIAKKVFKIQDSDFINPKRRPDLFVVGNSTCSITGLEEMEGGISKTKTILLIELKRGGFKLTSKERNQAQDYVEAITHSGISDHLRIFTFVVGESIDDHLSHLVTVDGNPIRLIMFSHIVDTASMRLFRLQEKIRGRYDEISGEQLAQKATQQELFKRS